MFGFLCWFLLFQVLYHIIVTIFWYGIWSIDQSHLALLRDWIWIVFCAFIFLINIKYWKWYFKTRWKILISFVILLLFSCAVSYLCFHKTYNDILIGIKYGLWRMLILLSSSAIWYFYKANEHIKKINRKSFLKYWLVGIVIVWRIWQFLKLLFPDIFFSLWYGKLDDFHYWEHPPIYYLTWYEGSLRWQWLFAWPNNYWYFLVLFFPLIIYLFPIKSIKKIKNWEKQDWINAVILLLWIVSILATLSRAAIIWWIIVILLYNIKPLLVHKKISITLFWLFLLWIIWLSIWKWDSTILHVQAKWNWIQEVINQPLWYWLWSSWPAIHHSWEFLPENYYLQLLLDMGTMGFLIRCWVLLLWLYEQKNLRIKLLKKNEGWNDYYQTFLALQKWLVALFVMWLFLHVFEDSMVNYLFFIPYGIILWYLSALAQFESNDGVSKNNW